MCYECERIARSTAPPWTGRYSKKELRAACAELGVKKPVRIQRATKWDAAQHGCCLDEDTEHIIQIRDRMPSDEANRTLLHELTHAAQFEREGRLLDVLYSASNKLFGYSDNPYEVDARHTADRLQSKYSIIR